MLQYEYTYFQEALVTGRFTIIETRKQGVKHSIRVFDLANPLRLELL